MVFGCNTEGDTDAGAGTQDTGSDSVTDTDSSSEIDTGEAYNQTGACGRSGEAIASVDSYTGTGDIFLIGPEPKFENDICRIRYDVDSISENVPAGCEAFEWAHTVQVSNVSIVTELGANCELSELGMGPDELNALNGATISYCLKLEYMGHAHFLMIYDDQGGEWEPLSMVAWSSDTGAFSFNLVEMNCEYYE